MISKRKKILITGASGLIGTILRQSLVESYDLFGIDVEIITGFDCLVADMTDLNTIKHAFLGKDVVIDLAAVPDRDSPWEIIYQNNMVATYNTLEAARLTGVKRVIFASSNHTVGGNWGTYPYRDIFEGRLGKLRSPIPMLSTKEVRPCCLYGVGKAFGENIASFYHERFGISCICIRIGGVSEDDDWRSHGTAGLSLWLSHRDAAQLVGLCIDAPLSVGYAVVYGISKNSLRFTEIETARDILGYNPQDDAGVNMCPDLSTMLPHTSDCDR